MARTHAPLLQSACAARYRRLLSQRLRRHAAHERQALYRALPLHGHLPAASWLEALLNHLAPEKFTAYSAGSHPKGTVHPYALEVLRHFQVPTEGLRSKSWEEFTGPEVPPIDFLFTLCDDAANTLCPVWPGHPVTAHWGLPDPAAVEGTDETKRDVFMETPACSGSVSMR